MDPYLLPVIGKSEKAAADLQKGCNGFVSAVPNVVVNWSGATDQLKLLHLQRRRRGAGRPAAGRQLRVQRRRRAAAPPIRW